MDFETQLASLLAAAHEQGASSAELRSQLVAAAVSNYHAERGLPDIAGNPDFLAETKAEVSELAHDALCELA